MNGGKIYADLVKSGLTDRVVNDAQSLLVSL